MRKVLLVAPLKKLSKGGMIIWTETYLRYANSVGINCDLLNIATIGSRAIHGNSKRVLRDEIKRTKNIFRNLKIKLSNARYDVAHINTSCGKFGLIRDYYILKDIKKNQLNCKCIMHFHCDVQKQCNSRLSLYFLKKILKLADVAFVLNEKSKLFINEFVDVSCKSIPNFIEESYVRKEPKDIKLNITEAIFVGYVQPEKGIAEVYELAKYFPNINFRLIGEVHSEVKIWNKPNNVHLLGAMSRSDIKVLQDKADVFIFLSHSEGFSLALLESMARGLPVLTTDVGANAEMLENIGGIIIPENNVEVAKVALSTLNDYEKRKKMSIWNIEKVLHNYTAIHVMQKFKTEYDEKCNSVKEMQ